MIDGEKENSFARGETASKMKMKKNTKHRKASDGSDVRTGVKTDQRKRTREIANV